MGITTYQSNNDDTVNINITGNFDYSCHGEFRESYRNVPSGATAYIINLGNATYMDSSALGMLLLLREHAGGDGSRISITNCDGDIRKILEISNFDKLFDIA
jgi:anti-anti-sigma factor